MTIGKAPQGGGGRQLRHEGRGFLQGRGAQSPGFARPSGGARSQISVDGGAGPRTWSDLCDGTGRCQR